MGYYPADSGNKDPGKEQTSAPGKENSWGRGFRRPSAGADSASLPSTTVRHPPSAKLLNIDGDQAGEIPRFNGSQQVAIGADKANGGLSAQMAPDMRASGNGSALIEDRQMPWVHGRPNTAPMDDIIEDTEDEED